MLSASLSDSEACELVGTETREASLLLLTRGQRCQCCRVVHMVLSPTGVMCHLGRSPRPARRFKGRPLAPGSTVMDHRIGSSSQWLCLHASASASSLLAAGGLIIFHVRGCRTITGGDIADFVALQIFGHGSFTSCLDLCRPVKIRAIRFPHFWSR